MSTYKRMHVNMHSKSNMHVFIMHSKSNMDVKEKSHVNIQPLFLMRYVGLSATDDYYRGGFEGLLLRVYKLTERQSEVGNVR